MTLLSLGLVVAFSLFERGSRALMVSDARSGLGGECRRAILALSGSLRMGDGRLCETLSRQTAGGLERSAYSLPTLSRWDEPTNFNLMEAQIYWDTYTVVYSTLGDPGRLVLQTYQPGPPPYYEPLAGLPGLLAEDPTTNANVRSTRVLTLQVDSFQATLNTETATMQLSLRLLQRGGRKIGAKQIDERGEASASIRLQNSGPI